MYKKGLFSKSVSFIIIFQFVFLSVPFDVFANIIKPDSLRVADGKTRTSVDISRDLLGGTLGKAKDGGDPKNLDERIIVRFREVDKNNVNIVGGKVANLGELQKVKGVAVPDGIGVTTLAFKLHIDNGVIEVDEKKMTVREYIEMRLKGLDYGDPIAVAEAGSDVRTAVEAAEMPKEVKEEITKSYSQLCEEAGIEDLPVAVRSSATAEDTEDASFAGQQDTYLNMRGTEEVLDAVKRNWASLFTDRAILYRNEQNIDHNQAFLSVGIQRMIESKTAGTAFSVHQDTGLPGVSSIDGSHGLGEGVVSGSVSPDSWVAKRDRNGEFQIYRKTFGAKLQKVVYRKVTNVKAAEGIELVDTSRQERDIFSLTEEQVKTLAKAVEAIHNHYGMYMDIEWAFDADGELWILQARPETVWNKWEKAKPNIVKMTVTVVPEKVVKDLEPILSGVFGGGAAAGKVVIIDAEKEGKELAIELARVGRGDILVTTMTKPDMLAAMLLAGAIVTDHGGRTCHAAIVAREMGICCIIGTGKATTVLEEGEVITVEANLGKVYAGELKIVEQGKDVDVAKLLRTKTELKTIVSSPYAAMKVWKFSKFPSHGGVGLVREEFAHATEILVHPLAGLAYDKKKIIDDDLRADIENTIKGYSSFKEFYKDKLANNIALIAATQVNGQPIILRTVDYKTNEYREQIGGYLFEPKEKNPMMGYRGINRMLDEAYREAFELEIEAIAKARKKQKNIAVMFPVVRTPEELKEAIDLFAAHGLVRGEDELKIGMMVEVPANIFQIEEFLATGIDFISIGSNDLTQLTLGLGRDNDKMSRVFDETNPAVLKALEIAIKTAKNQGITTGLCGQRPSDDPDFAGLLVEWGIDSISVVPNAYENVVMAVHDQEQKLEDELFNPEIAGWSVPEKEGNPDHIMSEEIRAGDFLTAINVHPQILLAYDRGKHEDVDSAAVLKGLFGGKTAQQYVTDLVYEEVNSKLKNTDDAILVTYATDDLDKTEFENMRGGKEREMFDENPQLGFTGLARVVDEEWREFFRWQIRGIKKAVDQTARPVGIRLNLARTFEEVRTALDIIEDEGLTVGEDVLVGMELAGPANVLLLQEFIDLGINFLIPNEERFLSYDMAVDPGNPHVVISGKLKENALKKPRRIWTTLAEENGVPMVQSAVSFAEALDERMFRESPQGFDKLAAALKDIDTSGAAVVIGAQIIFNHAGSITAIRELTDNNFKVIAWAKDEEDARKLEKMGMRSTEFIQAETLDEALDTIVSKNLAVLDKIAVVKSLVDIGGLELSKGSASSSVKSVLLRESIDIRKTGKHIDSMPLALARAAAVVFSDQETVVNEYEKITETACDNGFITLKEKRTLNELTAEILMPLIKVSEEVAQVRIAYEETVDKI